MYCLGTRTIDGREYTEYDIKQLIPAQRYGLDTDFYAGRVKSVCKTDTDILLLVDDQMRIVDTAVEDLNSIPLKLIKALCDKRKIPYQKNSSKDDLIPLLERR